ncbi:MAG: DUF2911 domain-containing protein [bacterium]|nr:DUF2911 domain-containing protein [bacterium]
MIKMNALKSVFAIAFSLFVTATFAQQMDMPAPSPSSTVEQEFGLSTITIDYSRPGVKGRTVFGDLVPYGKVWRTGANASTKIEFSSDVKVEGKDVPAGKYAIYTIPNETEWTVMLYKDLRLGGNVAAYDESQELVRFNVTPVKMGMSVESFTIDMNDLRDDSATIGIIWSDVYVPIKITIDTKSAVVSQIENFAKNPQRSLANNYYSAAGYYLSIEKDLDKALEWITAAVEIRPEAFWMSRRKSLIEAKLGNYKDAIKTAEMSKEVAEKAKNADYVKMNNDSIAEWKKMK